MKTSIKKEEILASSSGWVASLLNFFPGLGVGYIYQRRWIPYFITLGATFVWFILGIIIQGNNEPSSKEQLIGVSGLLVISIITLIESNLAQKKAIKSIIGNSQKSEQTIKKNSWFK